jgi:hypothetical protein
MAEGSFFATARTGAQGQQRHMQQVAGQLAERQRHAAVMLDEPRLRREHRHRRAGDGVVARRDELLQKRAKHRIDVDTRLQLKREARFDDQGMDMTQQARLVRQRVRQAVLALGDERGAVGHSRRFGLGAEQLPGDVGQHSASPRHDLVAEQRLVFVGQQMTQDRGGGRQRDVTLRELLAQQRFDRFERRFRQSRHSHRIRFIGTRLSAR